MIAGPRWTTLLWAIAVPLVAAFAACGGKATNAGDESGGASNLGGAPGTGAASGGGGSVLADGGGGTGSISLGWGEPEPEVCFELATTPDCAEGEVDTGYYETPLILATAAVEVYPGAHYVLLGERAVLLELPDADAPARYSILTVDWADVLTGAFVEWPDAEGQWAILDVVGNGQVELEYPRHVDALALGCDEAGCRLLGLESGMGDAVLPLEGWQVPTGGRVEHLTVGPGDFRPCVFGADLYCVRDGAWEHVLAAEEVGAARFTHASYGPSPGEPEAGDLGVVATDTGAVLVELSSGHWVPVRDAPPGGDAVVALERVQSHVSVLYESGVWVPDVLVEPLGQCELAGAEWAAPMLSGERSVVLGPGGDTYWQTSSDSWCRRSDPYLADTFAWGTSDCSTEPSFLALSETAVLSAFGRLGCGGIK